MKQALLAIDPQRDFTCPDGSLYVPGANDDMERLSHFVQENGDTLESIFVTMDSHRTMHIAHPQFWQDNDGHHPAPFTTITHADVVSGRWKAVIDNPLSTPYLEQLERRGKQHTIWPPHCIVGTLGYELHPTLLRALTLYAAHQGTLNIIHKGDCIFAEHFSALRAEVENPLFPETSLNIRLLDTLLTFDRLYIAGECADICVKETLRDILEYAPELTNRITVLTNCTSALSPTFSFTTDPVYSPLFLRAHSGRG